ncbi:MAG TPA: lipocalin family protein [Acidimicrobiia bacterium]|nr:lipocalin family protein [Acidimicrobiia bacterium]
MIGRISIRTLLGKRSAAYAAVVGATLSLSVVPLPARALAASDSVTAAADHGIPALVDPAKDLAAQVPGPELTWVDSIFIAGHVRGGGHDFGILVHTLNFPNAGQQSLYIGVTDTTTGWYKQYEAMIPKDQYSWDRTGLSITMPGLTWTGTADEMQVNATTPWGSLTARFTPRGPAFIYSGNGIVPLLDDVDHEYAFPTMHSAGSLVVEGRTFRVSGISWLDRQWGPVPVTDTSMRWTWMDIALSNGNQIAFWDILDDAAEHSFATVLRPNGSYELAAVTPLAGRDGAFWTSPTTGKVYPTRWRVEIPTLRVRLDVVVKGPKGQELPDGHVEATAAVTGRYGDTKVRGTTYIEMAGAWNATR